MINSKEIKLLFSKYLENQMSPDEIARLKILIRNMNEETFSENLYSLWINYEPAGPRNKQAFEEISSNMKSIIQPNSKFRLYNYILRYTVAACILALTSFSFYFYNENKVMSELNVQEYKVSTEKGERASITLSDGTKVYLNAQSHISYPALFNSKQRAVYLEGEAYFEVKHNKSVPFIVHTSKADIKVLGTTFNIYSYPDEKWFETTLVSGRIQVDMHNLHKQSVILSPQHKLRYNNLTGEYNTQKTDLKLETAWRKGDLIFRSENIHIVLKQIGTFYGINFHIEGNYPEKLFTGNYHEKDINQVLQNLQQHYTFTYNKKGGDIYLKFE